MCWENWRGVSPPPVFRRRRSERWAADAQKETGPSPWWYNFVVLDALLRGVCMFRRGPCCFCIWCSLIAVVLAWLLLAGGAPRAYSQAPRDPVSFINQVAPILKENCFACHDAKKRKGKLEMTTFETFRKGGTKDEPFVAGKPGESIVIDLLKSNGRDRMPPK